MTRQQMHLFARMLAHSWQPHQWFDRDDQYPEPIVEEKHMWVYIEKDLGYEVGFFDPKGNWHMHLFCETREEACQQVHWLNGGELH